jgi:septal ring factor EnvC (AmiA/AmiB activator)
MEHDDPLDNLAHHDSPRQPLPDRAHDMLQRQIDALLCHARTVTQQISDVMHRQQKIDAQISNADSRLADLQAAFKAHARENDERADRIEHRVSALDSGQATIIKELAGNTETTNQIKAILTTGRHVSSTVRWVGYMAAAGVAIWTLVSFATGGGFGAGP